MSPASPVLGLPYPVIGDTADVPRDIKALVDKLDPLGVVPVGALMMWMTAAPPSGWLLCQGQAVSAATYPGLANVLGSAGGNVTLPNLSDRVPLGAGTHALKSTGGAATVALTAAQTAVRAHKHTGTSGSENSSLNHQHNLQFSNQTAPGGGGGLLGGPFGVTGSAAGNTMGAAPGPHTHSFTTNDPTEVNGAAHENLPPYLAVNYIIRAG